MGKHRAVTQACFHTRVQQDRIEDFPTKEKYKFLNSNDIIFCNTA